MNRGLGALEAESFVLQGLDLLHYRAGARAIQPGSAHPLDQLQHIGATREFGDEAALAIANQRGIDVLIGDGGAAHGADMHAALVRKGAVTNVGLAGLQGAIGDLTHEARCLGEVRQADRQAGRECPA